MTLSNAENVITSNEITVTTPDIFYTVKELTGIHAAEGDGMVTLIWNKTNNKNGVDIERSNE